MKIKHSANKKEEWDYNAEVLCRLDIDEIRYCFGC
jgi:hypothetical protein